MVFTWGLAGKMGNIPRDRIKTMEEMFCAW